MQGGMGGFAPYLASNSLWYDRETKEFHWINKEGTGFKIMMDGIDQIKDGMLILKMEKLFKDIKQLMVSCIYSQVVICIQVF